MQALFHSYFYFVYPRGSGKHLSSTQVRTNCAAQDIHLDFGYLMIVSEWKSAVWPG